ncbi:hypothetical protein RHOM_04260 [Roseburia hominis A2-183]|uniref:Uncharacterized protein n=1 Tax=Roseburia hominis (strain DSM 16839 / JCM 17582 / NCIMB 14029 / A2-183) TaxID=585394 RepID=G2T0Y0_ROSHA|nr:hypothetical protein RHOM_04260 [Roseburia hominis A2-183]
MRAGASKPQTKIPSKPQPEMQPQMWHSRACVRQEGSTVGADAFPALKGTGIRIFSTGDFSGSRKTFQDFCAGRSLCTM